MNLNDAGMRVSITNKVMDVLSKLPKSHTRSEAFRAIARERIHDKSGEPIQPSIWYHHVCYGKLVNGKTIMESNFPHFVPAPTPYPRTENRDNSIHASIHKTDKLIGKSNVEILNELHDQLTNTLSLIQDILISNGIVKNVAEKRSKAA
jgi:hypothetical protein